MQPTLPTLDHLPVEAIAAVLDVAPQAASLVTNLAWRGGLPVAGSLRPLGRDHPGGSLDLLDIVRLIALNAPADPNLVAELIEGAPAAQPAQAAQLHPAATFALSAPATMRWITANPGRVAGSENWKSVLPGLGGVTVSVPLAEEAFNRLMAKRCKLPSDVTKYVQLNPWFSRRFAARYRRRMGGKRVRFPERAATARGWSHARTAVSARLPAPWQSLHGRGVDRPLDKWSHQLLANYVDLFLRVCGPAGVPATIASLFAVAAAGIGRRATSEAVTTSWTALPADVERVGRQLIGLPDPPTSAGAPEANQIAALRRVAAAFGSDRQAWSDLSTLAYVDDVGLERAVTAILA